jgi:hypothetical protein
MPEKIIENILKEFTNKKNQSFEQLIKNFDYLNDGNLNLFK